MHEVEAEQQTEVLANEMWPGPHSFEMRILGFKDQYLRASQGAGTWPLVGCRSPAPEVTRKRLLGQTPSDPNGAAWRTIPCSRRAIGRGSTSARTLSTPELDQLRGHTRK